MLNINAISRTAKEALANRGHSDDDIAKMTPEEAFTEYCEWHGLCRYGHTLWSLMKELNKAQQERPELHVFIKQNVSKGRGGYQPQEVESILKKIEGVQSYHIREARINPHRGGYREDEVVEMIREIYAATA
jgi:hypothetical protein